MSEEITVKIDSEKAVDDSKKKEKKDKVSSKKRKRSRSRSPDRKRSRSRKRSKRRSRSRHRSPKRRRSPNKSRRRRSRSRHRRSKSRDKRRRSKERRSRRSTSRKRKRNDSSSSTSSSSSVGRSSSSSGSEDEAAKAATKEVEKTKEMTAEVKTTTAETKNENGSKDVKESKSSKSDKRDRRRSRSPDRRRRSRSPRRKRRRSRERRRSRDRGHRSRRSRSRKRSSEKQTSRQQALTTTITTSAVTSSTDTSAMRPSNSKFSSVNPISKEFDQAKLEEEMRKRRERVEKWRMESLKKAQAAETSASNMDGATKKGWTLEDDDDDDEETVQEVDENGVKKEKDAATNGSEKSDAAATASAAAKEAEEKKEEAAAKKEEDIDPLDAYMMELTKSSKPKDNKGAGNNGSGPKVSRIVGVANSKKNIKENKGELMEGNMDAMEYSSEEEGETLDSAFSNFKNKQQPRKLEVVVDHTKIEYEPFKKAFYVEVPELAQMTAIEVETLRREEMEGVSIRGRNCPKPIISWVQAGVSMKVLNTLKKCGYEKPTPIQAQAIPAIMAGNDLIGIAKTGSGKTIAFLLPMFRHIMDQRPLDYGEGPIAVIMTPTRELAVQINAECHRFAKALKLKSSCVYGGTGISEQIAVLKRGPEIIVCTPGRMIDMMSMNNGGVTNMRRCTYLVMDEADRMFDMGFEPQVKKVIQTCRPDRQLVMFSATFPRQMEALARGMLNKPVEVQIGGRSVVCSDVDQNIVVLTEEQKYLKLLELLGSYQEKGSVLVFVDKQERADHLLKDLMGNSYSCMALHGGIDQYDRDSVINDFKSGVNRLLIATSVAARGLDVRNLILVVNFNCPNHYEDYVHRCGRTGRAGQKGTAYTFITPDQARHSGEIIKALELSGATVPKELEDLWLEFKREQTAAGKKVKQNSGFSGRGFKFDETEATLAAERKQIQKAALGLQDSDDDEPAQDIEEKIESMFNSKRIVKDVSRPLINKSNNSNSAAGGQSSSSNLAKLDMAKKLASRINLQKNLSQQPDVMQQAATALMKGGTFQQPRVSAKTIAEQVAERINSKLNYIPQEKVEETETDDDRNGGGTAKHYEEELEINDFPQTCRWKVTSKDTLSQISEYSEAGITIRGQFFAPGKTPGEDERKLYLAIEASSELSVQKAKSEITRLIKEELVRLQNSYQPTNKGRYKVL